MIRVLRISLLMIFLATPSFASELSKMEAAFKKLYPNVKYQSFDSGPINGLYEVVAGGNIFYYHPSTGYLFFGEIFNKEGVSLTGQRRDEIASRNRKGSIPNANENKTFEDAVKIGNGNIKVVEFSDPDCPYCRQASEFFFARNDVARYVYLLPLPNHPDAEFKAKYILCAKDRAKAYFEVYSGVYDEQVPQLPSGCNADAMLKNHIEKAVSAGIDTTPTFFINNKRVDGFDVTQIQTLLQGDR